MKLAFVGLGVMGAPMAGHLSKAGYEVAVYNRTVEKADRWCKTYGGTSCRTPKDAARGRDILFVCVGNDDDLRAVVLGEDGLLSGARAGALIVDHSTVSALIAQDLFALGKAKGVGFLDAPVSGGEAGAVNGALTVMVGGESDDFLHAEPVMRAYAKAVTHLGPVGSGQRTKMVNQIAIAGLVQALAEAIHFAQRAGLDVEKVIEAIGQGAAGSWQMHNRASTMNRDAFDFGFAVDWMRKDLGICFDEARRNGARLPVAALVDQFYADLQARGGNRWDTSALIRRLSD